MKTQNHRVWGLLFLVAVVVTTVAMLIAPALALGADQNRPLGEAQSTENAVLESFAGYHQDRSKQAPPQPQPGGGGPLGGPTAHAPQAPAQTPSHPSEDATATQILGAIRQCESGGNYRAINPGSGAGGAYQILPSTWREFGGSGLPQNASPQQQDQVAQRIYAAQGTAPWVCGRNLKVPGGNNAVPAQPQAKAPTPVTGEGIDVSEANGDIDWQAVHQSGRSWAIVKATEGLDYRDHMFGRGRVDAMRAAGVTAGYYHFARPQSGHTGAQEADHFLEVVRAAGGLRSGDIEPVLDIEVTKLDPQQTFEYARSFVDRVREKTGLETIVYTYSYFWRDQVASQGNLGSSLWIATYGSHPLVPASWRSEAMWQYSDSGHVSGVHGQVDLDHAGGQVPLAGRDAFKEPIPASTAKEAPAVARTAVKASSHSKWAFDLGALLAMLVCLCVCAPLARLSARQRDAYIRALAGHIADGLALPVLALKEVETGIESACIALCRAAKHQTRLVVVSLSEMTDVARLGQTAAKRHRRRRGACARTSPVRARRLCNARAVSPRRRARRRRRRICQALVALPGVLCRAGPLRRRAPVRLRLGPARVGVVATPQDAAPPTGETSQGPSIDEAPAPQRMRTAEANRRRRGPPLVRA